MKEWEDEQAQAGLVAGGANSGVVKEIFHPYADTTEGSADAAAAKNAQDAAAQATEQMAQLTQDAAAMQPPVDAASQTPTHAPVDAPADTPSRAPGDAPEKTSGNTADADARKPTLLEEALAATRIGRNEHHVRLVMVGDPEIRSRFLRHIEEKGLMTRNNGGGYDLKCSTKRAIEGYNKVARDMGQDYPAVRAIEMSMQCEYTGFMGALKKAFGNDHKVVVLVAGNEQTRA